MGHFFTGCSLNSVGGTSGQWISMPSDVQRLMPCY